MKEIPLTHEKVALVDDEDYERLVRFKWMAVSRGYQWYATRNQHGRGNGDIRMHREVMCAKPNEQVDHINRNGLDNRKQNLRFCTYSENAYNTVKPHGIGRSGFRGVFCSNRLTRPWRALFCFQNQRYPLGNFATREEAYASWREKALQCRGYIPGEVEA